MSEFHWYQNNSHFFTDLSVELFLQVSSSNNNNETTSCSSNPFNVGVINDRATTNSKAFSLSTDFEPPPSSPSP